jgi:integrase
MLAGMASVFKRPNSKFWHAGWWGNRGKFHLRSTKQVERSKALTIALEWERVDKRLGRGEMVENQVRQVINDLLDKVGEPAINVPSIKHWFQEWLAEKGTSKAEKTAERYKSVVDNFLEHLGDRAGKSLSVLTSRDIQSFVTKRQEKGVSSTTANLDAKILSSALNRARKQGIIQYNPAEAVDLPEKHSIERGVFTPAEIKMLLDGAKGTEWETVIMFGYFTGARLGDCTKMQWEKVDLANNTLEFFETKNQKWVTVPLHPDLQEHLSKLANNDKAQKHITPHMAELGPGGRHGLSEGFKRIVVNAGIDLQQVEGTGVRDICKRTFHALRHSFTSALANAGVSPELRMKLTGHKSAAIHKGYTHLEMTTLKDAIKKLPGLNVPPS